MRGQSLSALALFLAACGGGGGPIVLATGEEEPSALVAQGGTLYWLVQASATDAAAVRMASAQSGASTLTAVAGPRALALSSSAAIIGTTGGNVYQALFDGGALSVLIPKNGPDAAIAVATQGDFAYVAYNSGRLARVSISMGAVSLIELGSAANKVTALLADETNLYWLTSSNDIFFEAADGTGGVTKLNNLGATATAAALFQGSLYFLEEDSVVAVSISSSALSVALQGGNSCAPPRECTDALWGLASNGSSLFAGLTHGVGKLSPSTNSAVLVATVNAIGNTLAADTSNVYWSAPTVDANGQATGTSTIYRAGL